MRVEDTEAIDEKDSEDGRPSGCGDAAGRMEEGDEATGEDERMEVE